MVGNRRIRFVIVLDSCCISIGLVFIKDSWVSSFRVLRFRDLGVFVFEFWVLRFRYLGVFVFEFWVLRFRDRVLRFRVLGASFSRFGCFVLPSVRGSLWITVRVSFRNCFPPYEIIQQLLTLYEMSLLFIRTCLPKRVETPNKKG